MRWKLSGSDTGPLGERKWLGGALAHGIGRVNHAPRLDFARASRHSSRMRAFATLLLALALLGCKPATVDADPALWAVRDKDTTIYLFGTIHVLRPGLGWFDEAVKDAFDESDTLVLELVPPAPEAMQALVTRLGTSASGPPLSSRVPADHRAGLAQAFADVGQPPSTYERYDPWLAATTLSLLPLRRLGYADADGAEEVLRTEAQRTGKRVLGLETAEQQLGFFDRLSEPAQVQLLVRTLDDRATLAATLDRTVSAWSAGRSGELGTLVNADMAEAPELRQSLLVERNRRWAGWIARRLQQPGTVFVAVGAGHLAGEDSVQAQLERAGLKVERIAY